MSEDIYLLLRMAQGGDKEAAGRLIEENSGLIWSIARRFFGRGVDPDDLYQLGCVGFLKAIDGFDESYGTRFSTYAVPKISGEIRRFLRDDGMVKVSRGVKEQAQQIRSARMALEQRIGREPTISELARETGMSAEDIAFAETATGPEYSKWVGMQGKNYGGGRFYAGTGAGRLRRGGKARGACRTARRDREAARARTAGRRAEVLSRHDTAELRQGAARLAGADIAA